jgi:N-acetylglutamate synthase-like GNAT family acetyltransferase
MLGRMQIRRFAVGDERRVWALNNIPNVGSTADASLPLDLPMPDGPPPEFPDLADIERTFIQAGGEFLVVEWDGHLVGMGGIRPNDARQAEVLRIRVHPAKRRTGVGSTLMAALERRAAELGFLELHLDTATNQPDAVAFYRALGYDEVGQETHPEWSWTLVYFTKDLRANDDR